MTTFIETIVVMAHKWNYDHNTINMNEYFKVKIHSHVISRASRMLNIFHNVALLLLSEKSFKAAKNCVSVLSLAFK